jgi:hypothetical protein
MLIRLYFLLARRECVRAAFMHAKKPVFLGVVPTCCWLIHILISREQFIRTIQYNSDIY